MIPSAIMKIVPLMVGIVPVQLTPVGFPPVSAPVVKIKQKTTVRRFSSYFPFSFTPENFTLALSVL